VVNDDRVTIWTQYSTQWDALGHIGSHFDADGDGSDEVVYYNGRYPAPDVEAMAILGLEGRGVMVDLHRRYGREKVDVTSVMLAEVMCEQGVTVERGDILCLHTGFGQLVLDMKGSPDRDTLHNACPALDGADPELLQWVSESGVAAIVADNFAVERTPANWRSTPSPLLPLHELCLFKLGVNLGEIWYLTELAAWLHEHARFRFFLTAPPLRLPGHVGSPVTPIATV
jgi:kynurenine formamidase